MIRVKALCLVFSFWIFQTSSNAVLRKGPLAMELVSEQKTLASGEHFWLGWRIVRDKGWHTYWKHPGDVGVPPRIEWELPDSLRVEQLLYSPPQRVKMGEVGANGNYGETLFLCKFVPVAPLLEGSVLKISAKVSWLTCSRQCLPGFGNLSINLPVTEEVLYDPLWQNRFEAFRENMPIDSPSDWSFKAIRKADRIELYLPAQVRAVEGRLYFFSHGRQIRSHSPQILRKKNNEWVLSLMRSKWTSGQETELGGLLYRKEGWGNNHSSNYLRIGVPFARD